MELTTPKITCLMECSLDGRIDEQRWSPLFDQEGEGNPDVYYETRNLIDPQVALLGRNTIERNFVSKKFESPSFTKPASFKPFLGVRKHEKLTAVFDAHGTLAFDSNSIWGSTLIVILGEDYASEEYLDYLRQREISYTFAGSDGHDLKKAINSLYDDFGLKNILLAGGGILNGSFLKAGLIDELYLVLYPGIDGKTGGSAVFEYIGTDTDKPCEGQTLELLECKVVRAGVVLLHYGFHKIED